MPYTRVSVLVVGLRGINDGDPQWRGSKV